MARVRIALAGCGRMGRAHLAALADHPSIEVAAACDPALDEQSGLPCPLLPYEDVIASHAIEAVLIAAPTPVHERLTARALDEGKHVFCEKPLTLDPAADRALAQRASARGLVLQIGFWRRFAEPYLRVRDLLAAGRVGAVTGIRTAQWDARPPDAAFCDPRVSGGIEIDCGVHEFDLARWLLAAEVEAVTASSAPASDALAAVGDVETLFGLARLEGRRAMTIDLTRTAGHRDSIRTEVIGERGSLVTEFADTGTVVARWSDQRDEMALTASDVITDALRRQLGAFAAAIRTGRPHPDAATGDDSARALSAARAMREARDCGLWRTIAG
jgi:myo-inositol 2-dehydrogenase/D-chiro-inositol 1-dehydrogenase